MLVPLVILTLIRGPDCAAIDAILRDDIYPIAITRINTDGGCVYDWRYQAPIEVLAKCHELNQELAIPPHCEIGYATQAEQ